MKRSKLGQVWIETVIYTLIGLAIIGILLAVAKPKIDSMKDKTAIEQTIESLNNIDSKISEVQNSGSGNRRIADVKISKGYLVINASNDSIYWILDSSYEFSELGKETELGNLRALTTGPASGPWKVRIQRDYAGINITSGGSDVVKQYDIAPTDYYLFIANSGVSNGKTIIDVSD